MCGIYLTNITYEKSIVKDKLQTINFRGPDYMGITEIDDLIFGHLRLSILDLDKRSHQPMSYKHLTIVFNGEIYNYKDIREELKALGYQFKTESDTEVLLIGYYHWGKELLPKINGMFAFSIYNAETKEVFSCRDRMGVKPFYYYWDDERFEICSQIGPLLKDRKINDDSISIFLDTGYIPAPYTIAEKVYKLGAGCYMVIDLATKKLDIHKYWDLNKVQLKNISYTDAKEQLHTLLKDAVKIRLQSDVPIGSFLSGGIDSALVSSLAQEMSESKINTFCIGFDNPKFDESHIAEEFASIIDSNHNTTICASHDILDLVPKLAKVYDEPFADSSALPSLLLNKIAKQHVTVALSGDGGDESFLGYTHFDSLVRNQQIMKLPYSLRKFLSKPLFLNLIGQNSHRVRNALNTKSENDFIENIFSRKGRILKKPFNGWLQHYKDYKNWSKSILQKAADLNIKLWLDNNSNVKVDRASMAYSVEVRSPFLDYRVVEFARSLPIDFRYQKGRQKRILRDILKEYIPEPIFDQPKSGFSVPIGEWMRNQLRTEFDEALNEEFLSQVPNLKVKKFKKLYQEHMAGLQDNTPYIWKLFVLRKWYDEFQ
jgi:asparagine synthase (glutamine-hydrolysing)